MSARPLQQVLGAVGRHLQHARLATAARQAAWGSALVMSGGTLIHLTVRPLTFGGLFAAALVPWALALLQSLVTRVRPAECADWADRRLGGRSAYATALEHAGNGRSLDQPAQIHLEEWIAHTAPHSLALLAARPLEVRWREPMITALVCTALAAGLLQLPTHPLAEATTASSTRPDRTADAAVASSDTAATAATRAPAVVVPVDRRPETRNEDDSQGPPVAAAAGDISQETAAATPIIAASGAGGTATTTSGSGREAGSSRDLGADGDLTSAWSGALAKRVREVTASRGPGNTAADATRPVDYSAADAATDSSRGVSNIAAAATPPPASDALRVGPVERAYLRAYWAENGARP
jgi:hypothetical protein